MPMVADEAVFKKAKACAIRLLKFRPRSTWELRRKLVEKGYAALADSLIAEMTRMGMLDDRMFTRAWLQYRANKPIGFRRIRRELAEKGIAEDIVQDEWAAAMEGRDEFDAARMLAGKRVTQYINMDPLKRKKRVMDYLARRGFQTDIIMKVIKEL